MKTQNLLKTTVSALLACSCSVASAKGKIFSFESDAGGFNTKTIFYDNGQEVVAFDSQFTEDAALKAISHMRTQTQSRLRYLVITHPNPDKFNALSVYQKAGAEVIASRQTRDSMPAVHAYKKAYFVNAGMFTEETYPRAGTFDRIFDDKVQLKLAGGDLVELSELGRTGVSSNQTVAYIPAVNALVVGDLIHHKAHAWLEGGLSKGQVTPNLSNWIESLKTLKVTFGSTSPTVHGGRGEAVTLPTAIDAQIKYLQTADKLVSTYVRELGARRTELASTNAGEHYKRIREKFEKAFPDYQLAYMIEYGVYGLALQQSSVLR